MAYWLAKTEPDSFSYDNLEEKQRERWNGVRNPAALKSLRAMQPGDQVFIYHTGKEKAIAGIAEVVSAPYADPEEQDERFTVVDVAPVRRLSRKVSLHEIKATAIFKDWKLVRQPRLSVMTVTPEHWEEVIRMSNNAQ